jgi:hypothetical protein
LLPIVDHLVVGSAFNAVRLQEGILLSGKGRLTLY